MTSESCRETKKKADQERMAIASDFPNRTLPSDQVAKKSSYRHERSWDCEHRSLRAIRDLAQTVFRILDLLLFSAVE